MNIQEGKVYEIPGCVYSNDKPEYRFFIPQFTGDFYIVDCMIVDEYGNDNPDIGGAVPIYTDGMVLANSSQWIPYKF